MLLRHHHDARGASEGWWRARVEIEARQHSLWRHGRLVHVVQRHPAGDVTMESERTVLFNIARRGTSFTCPPK